MSSQRSNNLLNCFQILEDSTSKELSESMEKSYLKLRNKIKKRNPSDYELITIMERILRFDNFRGILIKELGVDQYRTLFVVDEDAHPLSPDGRYIEEGDWSVHVKSDLVIVYRYETDNTIKLVKLKYVGSHQETHTKESVIGKILDKFNKNKY